jgi:hypothetical protein
MSENNYYAAAESKERPLDPDMVRMTAQATWEHAVDGAHILNRRYLRGKRVGLGQHGAVYLAFDLVDNDRQVVSGVSEFSLACIYNDLWWCSLLLGHQDCKA